MVDFDIEAVTLPPVRRRKKRRGRVNLDWQKIASELQEHPGKWGQIAAAQEPYAVWKIRHRKVAEFTPFLVGDEVGPGFRLTTRRVGPKDRPKYDLYMMFDPGNEKEQ